MNAELGTAEMASTGGGRRFAGRSITRESVRGLIRHPVGAPAFIGGVVGVLGFNRFEHFGIVNPRNVNAWIAGDWGTFMLGWLHYRNSPMFGLPLGQVPSLGYPLGTSLIFTDSIPLAGLLLRPFSSILPEDFQFLGLFLLMSFVLQGVFGALIASIYLKSHIAIAAAAGLFVWTPAFIVRNVHTGLTAHWIILAVIYFGLKSPRRTRWWLVGLVCITALIHPYIWMFCTVLLIGIFADDIRRAATTWQSALLGIGTTLVVSVALLALVGAFSSGYESSNEGFGTSGANVLTLVAGDGWSRHFNHFSSAPGQAEGFAYLGLGTIVLVLVSILSLSVAWWIRRREVFGDGRSRLLSTPKPIFMGVAALLLFIYAMSDHIYFGSHLVVNASSIYSIIEPITDRFRSSGRAAWPLMYLIIAVGIAGVAALARLLSKRIRRPELVAAAVLLGCVLVQSRDLVIPDRHYQVEAYFFEQARPDRIQVLDDPRWQLMGEGDYEHMSLIPVTIWGCSGVDGVEAFYSGSVALLSLEAYRAGLTFNSGFFSRMRTNSHESCEAQRLAAAEGRVEPDTVYVLTEDGAAAPLDTKCGSLDTVRVCVLETNDDPFSRSLTT